MSDISIKELSNLTRAVNGIADKISKDPFKSMHEDGRHQEIINIQKKQTEILNQQKRFTGFLVIATIVLGLGTLLQVTVSISNTLQFPVGVILIITAFLFGFLSKMFWNFLKSKV